MAEKMLLHSSSRGEKRLGAIEDETGIANLVIWSDLYEKQRRIILSAGMIAVHGRIQREGEVVHLIAHLLTDLSGELASIGEREMTLSAPQSHSGRTGFGRGTRLHEVELHKPWDNGAPVNDTKTIKVPTRDFR